MSVARIAADDDLMCNRPTVYVKAFVVFFGELNSRANKLVIGKTIHDQMGIVN